jgi:hypothetical protein
MDPRYIVVGKHIFGPIDPPGNYCFWRGPNRGKTPELPIDHVCKWGHAACPTERQRREIEAAEKSQHAANQPTMSRAEIKVKFAELLEVIGAKPGEYTIKGSVPTRPGYAATTCILYESKRIE